MVIILIAIKIMTITKMIYKEKLSETERITAVGSYWDNKGENEIDLIAINELDKTGIVAEVKRNPRHINLERLTTKTKAVQKELAKYKIELKGFSIKDM